MEKKIFLGKYRIIDAPRGAMPDGRRVLAGGAHEAREIVTGKKVVVELVPAASLRPSVRTQLAEEAQAAKQLRHPNIPLLHDFGVEDGQLVYVTEYFDGTTTEEWVTEHGPMEVETALRIAVQVVSALGAAAFYKIFHHAINPRNLMIVPGQTAEGEWPLIKVVHLVGVAPSLAGTDVSMARFDNSAAFASPEQIQLGKVDFRSEIFSLGCTLWFLLTGAAPFVVPGDPVEAAPTRMSLAVERLNDVPKHVRRLLGRMLATNADERPLDPILLEEEIRTCVSDLEADEPIVPGLVVPEPLKNVVLPIRGRRRISKRALALAAMLLVLAALAVTVLPELLQEPARFSRSKTGSEPIGVPIGIPEASVAPNDRAPAGSNLGSVSTDNSGGRQTEAAVAEEKPAIPAPATTAPPAVAANQVASTPIPSTSTNPPVTESSTKRPAPLVASEIPAPPKNREPAPPAEPPPNDNNSQSPQAESRDSSDVAAAAPEDSGATASAEENSPATPAPTILPDPPKKAEPAPAVTSSRAKTRAVARSPKKRGHQRGRIATSVPRPSSAMLRTPRGMVRARVVGTTADGDVVLALPSHHVVVLPPPPDF